MKGKMMSEIKTTEDLESLIERVHIAQNQFATFSEEKVNAIFKATDYVKSHVTAPVPPHLCDAHYPGAAKLNHGLGYRYAHDYPNHYVKQQYLPDGVEERFFEWSGQGYEKELEAYFQRIKKEIF